MRSLLVLFLWLCGDAFAAAQCVGGVCSVPTPAGPAMGPVWTPSIAPVTPVSYREFKPISKWKWVKVQGNSDQEALLEDGVQVGAWSLSGGYYRSLKSDGSWGPKQYTAPDGSWAKPPVRQIKVEHRAGETEGEDGRLNFGMDYKPEGSRYVLVENGKTKEVSRSKALDAVKEQIPDDSKKFRVTLIGSKEDRKKASEDLAGLTPEVKDKVIVHQYDAQSPLVKKLGLVSEGKPTVYLQAPDGQVLGRNLDGTWDVSRIEAIEDEVKSYDPAKDTDLLRRRNRPILPSLPTLPQFQTPWWIYGAGIVVLLLLLKRK